MGVLFFALILNINMYLEIKNYCGPSGYERGLTGFCSFVKIRVFVGISVFTRVLVYRTFVHFQGVFGEDFTQFLPNG